MVNQKLITVIYGTYLGTLKIESDPRLLLQRYAFGKLRPAAGKINY